MLCKAFVKSLSTHPSIRTMIWQLCIQYSNGAERVLRSYNDLERALQSVDSLYSNGYPMHVAYVVRQSYT